jgi:hypothetical protein
VRRLTRDQLLGTKDGVALTRLTINHPPTKNSLIAMPAVNLGATTFEIPENAVRVLLTGYGVSLAITNLLDICHTHY